MQPSPLRDPIGPGAFEFDFGAVERAIGRGLSTLDLRVLREGAIRAAEDDLDLRLALLTESIEDAGG